MVSDYLAGQGFSVCGVASGAALDAALSERPADLLIIDLNLPAEDGFSIARRIRAGSAVPIIMLTGAADVVDRIVGLEMGADDYVTKPFDLRELKARIRAVLRRASQPASSSPVNCRFHFAAYTADIATRSVIGAGGEPVDLTGAEFELLRAFLDRPGRILSREQLLDLTQGREAGPLDRSIDVLVSRLRKKLSTDANSSLFKTVRNGGYQLAAHVEREEAA